MPTRPQTDRPRWLRRPIVHFVVLGILAYAISVAVARNPTPKRKTIELAQSRVNALQREDSRRMGVAPDEERTRLLIRAEADDSMLLAEALDAGLHLGDRVVRDRLVRNLRFLDTRGSDAELFERALELGMHRTDVVVRRRLIQAMRLLLATSTTVDDVDEGELREYLQRHADRFMSAQRVKMRQVFFDARLRGTALEADADAASARLCGGAAPQEIAGDTLLVVPERLYVTVDRLETLLGPVIASAAAERALGEWSEPLRSSYGLHLIRIDEREAPHVLPLREVRNRIEFEIRNERRKRALADGLDRLRASYDVRIVADTDSSGDVD